jgi:leucyl aminopeptidase
MKIKISKSAIVKPGYSLVAIISDFSQLPADKFSDQELGFIKEKLNNENQLIEINKYDHWVFIYKTDTTKKDFEQAEAARKIGDKLVSAFKENNIKQIVVENLSGIDGLELAIIEGITLGSYQFLKHKTKDVTKKLNTLEVIDIFCENTTDKQVEDLSAICEAVYWTRDLVNEPANYQSATQLSEEFEEMGKKAGFSVKVLHKKEIEDLKMGGLLSVNQGSVEPPTFNILEWKPENAVNTKPIVLVGKGLTYDTGGYSLKPTKDSMDYMKCDMAGGALVAGVVAALTSLKAAIHVIALVPSTDNRIAANAYSPGDVITMFNGLKVEVMNCDAEGRLILADALSYAAQYEPELVMDFATLTGAAARLVGPKAACVLGNAGEEIVNQIKQSGFTTFERIVELPIWDDYADGLKSEIADMNNVAGPDAGTITATKFLEKFTSYPWLHFDIAGPAYLLRRDSYRGMGATAYGVRLITDFLRKKFEAKS